MALKKKLTPDEHAALDEALQSFYVESDDGYTLDIEGDSAPAQPDAGPLRRALDHEKRQRADAVRRAKELEAKLAELESKPAATPAADPASAPADDWQKRLEAAVGPLKRQNEDLQKRLDEADKARRDADLARKRSELLGKAKSVASQLVRDDLLEDFIAARVNPVFELDEESGEYIPRRSGETIWDSENPSRPAPVEQVIRALVEDKSAAGFRKPSRGIDMGDPAASPTANGYRVSMKQVGDDPTAIWKAREAARKAGKELELVD